MVNKKNTFSDAEITKMAKRFKMLSEVSRMKIVRTLFEGEKCVSDIIESTGLLQANVSKQLRMLETDGVVSCRPSGLQRFYKVADPTVFQLCQVMCNPKKN